MSEKKDSPRRGVYMTPTLQQLIAEREASHRSASAVLGAVADRYLATVRRCMPALTVREWMTVFDALHGVWTAEPAELVVTGVPHQVADAIHFDGIDAQWDVDGQQLVKKLEAMDWCQLLAVLDAAERFWSRAGQEGFNAEEAVRAVVGPRGVRDDSKPIGTET